MVMSSRRDWVSMAKAGRGKRRSAMMNRMNTAMMPPTQNHLLSSLGFESSSSVTVSSSSATATKLTLRGFVLLSPTCAPFCSTHVDMV